MTRDDAVRLYREHAGIAPKVASRYARYRRDRDDLEAEARLALWKACLDFDPGKSHQGAAGAGPYFVQRVNWHLQRLLFGKRPRSERPLHLPLHYDDGRPIDHADPRAGRAVDRLDAADYVAWLLPLLTTRERQAAGLFMAGVSYGKMARVIGVSKPRAQQLIQQVARRAGA